VGVAFEYDIGAALKFVCRIYFKRQRSMWVGELAGFDPSVF
jgi:hypothetical protein